MAFFFAANSDDLNREPGGDRTSAARKAGDIEAMGKQNTDLTATTEWLSENGCFCTDHLIGRETCG